MKALIYFKIFIILIHLLSRSFKQIFIQIFKNLTTTLTAAVVTSPGDRRQYSSSIIPVDSTYLELGKNPIYLVSVLFAFIFYFFIWKRYYSIKYIAITLSPTYDSDCLLLPSHLDPLLICLLLKNKQASKE